MKQVKLISRHLLRNLTGIIIRRANRLGLFRILPYKTVKLPKAISGLCYCPSLGSREKDGQDSFFLSSLLKKVPDEYSARDRDILKEIVIKMGNSCQVILEIGVARNYENSSTKVFLDHKKNSCWYLGVDLEDKSFLNNKKKRIMTVQTDSGNFRAVCCLLKRLQISRIDILHIDGWHSVTQAIADWQYSDIVRPGGYIILHDASVHPGPALLFAAIDQTKYQKSKYYCELDDDWGIAVIKKRYEEILNL